jgi:hypothetical protein
VRADKLKAMKAEQAAAKKKQKALALQASVGSAAAAPAFAGFAPTPAATSSVYAAGEALGAAAPPNVATAGATAAPASTTTTTTTDRRAKITFGLSTGLGGPKRKQNPNVLL